MNKKPRPAFLWDYELKKQARIVGKMIRENEKKHAMEEFIKSL